MHAYGALIILQYKLFAISFLRYNFVGPQLVTYPFSSFIIYGHKINFATLSIAFTELTSLMRGSTY